MVEVNDESLEKVKKALNRTVIDNFTYLTHQQEAVRFKGIINLLRHLSGDGDSVKDDEVKYAFGRIIRGLGASTSNARTGFYTALVALLNIKNEITVDVLFEHILKHLNKSGSNSKSENADISSGQILACGAIIRSNLWERSSFQDKFKVFECLMKSSRERSYLKILAYQFAIAALDKVDERGFQKILPILENEIAKPWSEQNLDTLYMLYSIKNKCPNIINEMFLKKVIGTHEIICPENIGNLCLVLMSILRLASMQHFVYELVAEEIADSVLLSDFVEELDKHIDYPNRNKQLLVAHIFTLVLQKLKNPSVIPVFLTKNFVQQTLNFYKTLRGKNQDPEFQQIMQNFFDQLLASLKCDNVKSKTKIIVLRKLLLSPGTFIFEKITKSKLIQLVTLNLNNKGVKKLAELYRGVIDGTEIIDSQYGHGEDWLNNDKLYAAHLLIKLLNHTAVKEENDWKVEQLSYLMNLGLLRNENGTHIGSELAASLKTAFFGSLDLKLTKLEDLHAILIQLVQHLDSKLNTEDLGAILRNPLTEEQHNIWKETFQIITKIFNKLQKKKKVGLKSVFLTLFLHMGLQLFNEPKLATDSLNELFICYQKTKKNRDISQNFDDTVEDHSNDNSDLLWIEVVIDLILNLLSHNSHLLRSIIKTVFPHLCQYMTPSTIHQLLSVMDPKNEDNPLSKGTEESSSEEDDDSENETKEEHSEEDDDDDDDDDEDANDETVNDKLRMALHKVLISNGYKSDEESIDIDQMSETEGEKLDKALADAFRQFKPNHGRRNKQTKDEETLTHFRIRVLDLVEIYVESTPSMLISLEIMLPLLQSVEFCIRDEHQKALMTRLKSCLKKLTNLKKFSDTDGVNETVLHDLLKSLLDKGSKTAWIVQDMGSQIADCCLFIIRCSNILLSSEGTPKKIKKRLKSSIQETITKELEIYMHQRDCFTPLILFKNILRQSWDGSLGLVSLLLQYIFDKNIKPFKKNQVFELLKLFYTNQRYLSSNSDKVIEILSEDHSTFSENVLNLFRKLSENAEAENTKEKFVCNLFDLLATIKSTCLNVDNIRWQEIAENVREYRSTVTLSKDSKACFNRLCHRLGVSNVVKMKPRSISSAKVVTSDADDNDEEKNVEKKKRKSKNKEKLRLKKEAKELRLKSLSEGFGGVDFKAGAEIDMESVDTYAIPSDVVLESSKNPENGIEEESDSSEKTSNTKKRKVDKEADDLPNGQYKQKSQKKKKLDKDDGIGAKKKVVKIS
ncbi:MYB binding protein 1a isoform X1 [Leptinotarsa decemlineata]|uniref:MYB binding protein 1a isoform X1 n=1 Tax=Leptinotarsa decemlineata TaxID=7539 RepID=UPI003D306AC3